MSCLNAFILEVCESELTTANPGSLELGAGAARRRECDPPHVITRLLSINSPVEKFGICAPQKSSCHASNPFGARDFGG